MVSISRMSSPCVGLLLKLCPPMSCHEKVTGTCHSERSEASEVGHAARLVRPDASLPLSMTREGAFFTACHKQYPRACHAERQRSIQATNRLICYLGCFAAAQHDTPANGFNNTARFISADL